MRLILLTILLSVPSVLWAQSPAISASEFKTFTEMRIGTGAPVYWYCIGEIYEYPGGKLVAKVEGIDTARFIASESSATRKLQVSRKIFFYRDPKTNALIREVNGVKADPIAYPYQQITYELVDGSVRATVVQGRQPRVQTIESAGGFSVRKLGDNLVFSTPLFLNFPGYKAYENYDFFFSPRARGSESRYQLTWNRRGNLPPFFGGGDSVFQLVAYRIDDYRRLPKSIREVLEADWKLWMNPPKDLKEIAELQKS